MSAGKGILLGGLSVGVIDGVDAVLFFGMRGTQPAVVFQAIASGLLGSSAFDGGVVTVVMGVALHFGIGTTIVAVACLAATRLAFLARYPVRFGLVYGLSVYLVMTFIVLPLSRATGAPPTLPVLINGVLVHMVGVGLPATWFARTSVLGPT